MMTVHATDHDYAPLSASERAALRALHRGWRFGVDPQSEQSLEQRGLVTVNNWQVGALVFHEMPFLTDHGARIAARLIEEQESSAVRRRLPPGFAVVQGGRA